MVTEIVIYLVLGYWATGQTIYRNKILMGTASGIFLHRLMLGFILGIVLIPWAILAFIIRTVGKK